jgi:hypothetical protein
VCPGGNAWATQPLPNEAGVLKLAIHSASVKRFHRFHRSMLMKLSIRRDVGIPSLTEYYVGR